MKDKYLLNGEWDCLGWSLHLQCRYSDRFESDILHQFLIQEKNPPPKINKKEVN